MYTVFAFMYMYFRDLSLFVSLDLKAVYFQKCVLIKHIYQILTQNKANHFIAILYIVSIIKTLSYRNTWFADVLQTSTLQVSFDFVNHYIIMLIHIFHL